MTAMPSSACRGLLASTGAEVTRPACRTREEIPAVWEEMVTPHHAFVLTNVMVKR
ncbi:hypothetical protein [Streptomyces phaeochromogenes]|uniref:hypothetical protein n=1 Tax=Streptomyces phaeochromogenes TaxID=1923 RepID=UPI003F4D1D38